ncbi:hypothetical protein [Streptomyces sp. 6N223]|uniref:hypothetical protein n=1 Tax=Streptomyces sp. 6N223 TaxID=3457412 RepID=UPI003FD1715B
MLTLIENRTVTGSTVRIGDAVPIGGDHHEVVDLRTLPGMRKMLVFADGSYYVLPSGAPITVTRARVAGARARRVR